MAKSKSFSIEGTIKDAWKITKDRYWLLFGIFAVSFLATQVPMWLSRSIFSEEFSGLVELLLNIYNVAVSMAVSLALLQVTRNKPVNVALVWTDLGRFFQFLLTSFVMAIMVVLGFIFFIIPGVYLALKYMFAPFLIIDKGLSMSEAFKRSAAMTDGSKLTLFFFGLVLLLINVATIFTLGLGLLVTIPLSSVAQVLAYEHFLGKSK